MKFSEIIQHLKEQHGGQVDNDDDEEQAHAVNNPEDDNQELPDEPEPDDFDLDEPEPAEPEPEDLEPDEPEPAEPEQDERTNITRPSPEDARLHNERVTIKLNAIDKLKLKWKNEALQDGYEIEDGLMSDVISFFNDIKNNLREVKGNESDIPQMVALKRRFPDFPADNKQKIRDIQNYSWDQINFFRERYVEEVDETRQPIRDEDILFVTSGSTTTNQSNLEKAVQLFKNNPNVFYQNGNVTVREIRSQNLSITYGQIQNYLQVKYIPSGYRNYWCTTANDGGLNMYVKYRLRASQYYILNENLPEDHEYYFFSIRSFKEGDDWGPNQLTNRMNSDNILNLTINEIIQITGCQQLREIADRFVYFPQTKEEALENIFRRYTFDGRHPETDFAFLTPSAQLLYIQNDQKIKSAKALQTLGIVKIIRNGREREYDLQMEYTARVDDKNFKTKFISEDPTEDPFDMLRVLRSQPKVTLHQRLKEYKVMDGIYAVSNSILSKSLKKSYREIEKDNIILLQTKNDLGFYGVFDFKKYKWVKPAKYSMVYLGLKGDKLNKIAYAVCKYISDDDYFYWILTRKNYYEKHDPKTMRKNEDYHKGTFMTGHDGDAFIADFVNI